MKPRHKEWLKLTSDTKTALRVEPQQLQRLPIIVRDLPGFAAIEDKLLLYGSARNVPNPELDDAIGTLSKSTFGVTLEETVFKFPQGYDDLPEYSPKRWRIDDIFDEFESQFETSEATDDEAVEALLRHGLDFRDARGFPMRCTMKFCRQAEAAAKGIMGKMPDRTAADLESWAKQMELAAKKHLDKKRDG